MPALLPPTDRQAEGRAPGTSAAPVDSATSNLTPALRPTRRLRRRLLQRTPRATAFRPPLNDLTAARHSPTPRPKRRGLRLRLGRLQPRRLRLQNTTKNIDFTSINFYCSRPAGSLRP